MAYVLGFLFADGNIIATKRGAHFVSFYSSDRVLLQQMKRIMKSNHKLSKRNARSGHVYRTQIGSKEIFKDLIKLGLTPLKSARMKMPRIPRSCRGSFIRGYFDGDGNVWSGVVNKSRSCPSRVIRVSFTSASNDFLTNLLMLIKKTDRDLRGGAIYKIKNKNCSRLSFSTQDSLRLYKIMYNSPCTIFLKRKKVIFEKYAAVAQFG